MTSSPAQAALIRAPSKKRRRFIGGAMLAFILIAAIWNLAAGGELSGAGYLMLAGLVGVGVFIALFGAAEYMANPALRRRTPGGVPYMLMMVLALSGGLVGLMGGSASEGGMQNRIPTLIIAALGGMLAFITMAVTFPVQLGVTDTYYLEYVNRCVINNGSENFIRLYGPYVAGTETIPAGASSYAVVKDTTANSTQCSATLTVSAADVTAKRLVFLTEHEQVGFTASAAIAGAATPLGANSEWKQPLEILKQYSNISRLILQVSPIIGSVGFLGLSVAGLLSYAGGTSGIMTVILRSLGGLIVGIAIIYLGPQIMTYLNDIYILSSSGRLEVMQRFSTIITLVLAFAPVLYNASILILYSALGAWQGMESGYIRGRGRSSQSEGLLAMN